MYHEVCDCPANSQETAQRDDTNRRAISGDEQNKKRPGAEERLVCKGKCKGSSTDRRYPCAMQLDSDNSDQQAPGPYAGGRSVETARPIEPVRPPEVPRVLEPARRPVAPRT
jgi:hypothetical protein